ncbi:DUF6221 family protein [Streptomyces albidoflavus]
MNDLIAFLQARLDEDEVVARSAYPGPWSSGMQFGLPAVHASGRPVCRADAPNVDHIARHDPAHILAEVQAKRLVLGRYLSSAAAVPDLEAERARLGALGRSTAMTDMDLETVIHQRDALLPVLHLLALPYADHPDYREEWRP